MEWRYYTHFHNRLTKSTKRLNYFSPFPCKLEIDHFKAASMPPTCVTTEESCLANKTGGFIGRWNRPDFLKLLCKWGLFSMKHFTVFEFLAYEGTCWLIIFICWWNAFYLYFSTLSFCIKEVPFFCQASVDVFDI